MEIPPSSSNIKFDEQLIELCDKYLTHKEPIEFSFRKAVPNLANTDRATHLIHPYPAKLLMHIPYYFLNNDIISKEGDVGLDPFCGSGTVLLESILAGRNCLGVDANPLAQLISQVKTSNIDITIINKHLSKIKKKYFLSHDSYIPGVINIDHWFSKRVQLELSELLAVIRTISDIKYYNFFLICFSVCVRKVSNADPRVSVPVKLKIDRYNNHQSLKNKVTQNIEDILNVSVLNKFCEIVESNTKRIESFNRIKNSVPKARVISNDARKITSSLSSTKLLPAESVDYVITSPPYAGAQKYIRASSLNLCWTELSEPSLLKQLDNKNIGREMYLKSEYLNFIPTGILDADIMLEEIYKEYPLRSHIASNYIREMKIAFTEITRVLKKGKYFVLVAANNQVCGRDFPTQYYLKTIAIQLGFNVELELIDDIHSYGLMTKRNKTASVITREWITVLKKK